jgi:hypothetical protein
MSTARWTRVPIPHANSGMQFYGICRDFTPAGVFRVKILSVALNVAANSSAPSDETQQPPGESTSAPVTPAKHRKFSPSLPSSVATDPVVPTTVSTEVYPPSNVPVPSGSDVPSVPMFYSHPFQHYPQQASTASGPFMAPFLPPLPYSLAGHPMFSQLGFSSNAAFNSRGEYISPTSIDSRVLNSSADPGSSSAPGRSNDEESAFNKSAADPYKYPMTQV